MKTTTTILFITLTMSLPPAFAQDSGSDFPAQGHKPKVMLTQMMGGGMMGGGMMGQSPKSDQTTSSAVNPERADALLAYIRNNRLPCASCHSVSGNGVGPSFASVAAKYSGRDDAAITLKDHIANGFGRMPSGLASKSKAAALAKLIMDLAKPE